MPSRSRACHCRGWVLASQKAGRAGSAAVLLPPASPLPATRQPGLIPFRRPPRGHLHTPADPVQQLVHSLQRAVHPEPAAHHRAYKPVGAESSEKS